MKILVLFISLVASTAFADPSLHLLKQRLEQQQEKAGIPIPPVKAGVYQQKLDHFSKNDVRVFNQRYWAATLYGKKTTSPVILYVCGEGSCGPGSINFVISNHARSIGASIYALEHRYYGRSQPFDDLKTENLVYLKTDQVLQDLVDFKLFIQQKTKSTGPWIIAGGSYAGALAAYSRQKHPDHFIGALSSSGAVRPDANFDEYDIHVGKLAGAECVQDLQKVLAEIESAIVTDAGYSQMKERFSVTLRRQDDFLQLLSDIASASIQLGSKKEFCEALKTQGIDGYIQMKQKVFSTYGNFENYSVEAAEDTSLTGHSGTLGMRQWFYQGCTEYGLFQVASPDPLFRARSTQINSEYSDHTCQRLFGLSGATTTDFITQKYYAPLLDPSTSRILFTNGVLDPWKSTSINTLNSNTSNPNTESLMMEGALHCNDLYNGGSDSVMAAKSRFLTLAKGWLGL